MWEKVKLGDLATFVNGYPFKPSDWSDEGLEIIRIQNLTRSSSDSNYYNGILDSKYKITKGDILISWSATLGVYTWDRSEGWLNQHIFKVIFNKIEINKTFFIYLIEHVLDDLKAQVHGATMKHITKGNFDNTLVPLPPLPIQEKIAKILDKADELRRKDKDLQTKYDELAQAIFIDMFGDPVKNEKGWEVKKLYELGYLKNGLNYGNNESGKELKVFGVGDFKSNWLFDDYNNLKSLSLDAIPNKSFLLADGDILFVRSNGNKDLIGRAVLLKNINTEITYSGFCIKFTRTSSAVNAYYLIRLLVNSKFKKYILNGGRGANIQNINQEILSALNIPIPPIPLQEAFAKKIELINQLKGQINAEKSEELFQSLLQKAFKGELVS